MEEADQYVYKEKYYFEYLIFIQISPSVSSRPPSKLSRLKFGHPIKIRPPEFYGPNKTETELRLREESFINDSIRSATQSRRSSIIPHYEALDDPYLRRFFQSPFVLDVVRKTLNIEHKNSYKQDERSTKLSNTSQRSITVIRKQLIKYNTILLFILQNDPYDNRNDDYLRIVSKSSSGYAKLNGYDCIPSYSPARHRRRLPRRSSTGTGDSTTSSPQRTNTNDSRLNHLTTHDKRRESTNILIRNFPTNNSNQLQKQQKKKTYISEKSKQLKPNTTSSALKHLVQHSVEGTTSNVDNSSTTKTNGNAPEQKNESAVSTTVSQD